MKIDTKELKKALDTTKVGIAKNDIVEQSTHFIFTGKDICTYNDKICLFYPFTTEFTCSIKADDFYKIIQGIMDEEIDLTLIDSQLKIKAKGTKAGISVSFDTTVVDIIKGLPLDTVEWNDLPKNFLEGLSLCLFSATNDVSQGYLSCIGIQANKLFSSDNIRVSQFTMDTDMNINILFPATSAMELVRNKVDLFGIKDSWAYFQDENGVVFGCRLVAGEYPDISSYFESIEGADLEFPKGTKDVVLSTLVMVEGEAILDKVLNVAVSSEGIVFKSEKGTGWVEKTVESKYEGNAFKFMVNPILFSQVLEKTSHMTICEDRAFLQFGSFAHIMALPV